MSLLRLEKSFLVGIVFIDSNFLSTDSKSVLLADFILSESTSSEVAEIDSES